MEDLEHFEFLEFMQEQELKIKTTEANSELDEEINPTTGE
jgi:hypothetical protein|tara:strand:- start:351 stop:470 length:120 start_codon:yes stop_codon:yes gene_type:complete